MLDEIHTYFHCRTCLERKQTERIEVGLTDAGIRIQCPKHGKVLQLTPEQLEARVARGPQCDCCAGPPFRF